MSMRVGPPDTSSAQVEASDAAKPAAETPSEPVAVDLVAQTAAPKAMGREPSTSGALEPPVEDGADRRARLGGDRGAWTARVREGIMFAAANRDVGQTLLDAYSRGRTTVV